MSALVNKEIMAKNIRRLMEEHHKDRRDICKDLGVKYTTFTDWYNGKTYPRIDKIEMLANYFGVSKSELVEQASTTYTLPKIIQHYNKLNDIGKNEATKRVKELTYLPQYTDSALLDAAHAYSGKSEEEKKFDEDILDNDDLWK